MATKKEGEAIAVLQEQNRTTATTLLRIENKVDDGFKALDKKFAAKWVQTVMAGFLAAVLLAFAYAVINFFIPKHTTVAEPKTAQSKPSTSTTTNITNTTTPVASPPPAPATENSSGGLLDILKQVIQ